MDGMDGLKPVGWNEWFRPEKWNEQVMLKLSAFGLDVWIKQVKT